MNNLHLVPIDFAVQQLAGGVPHPGGQAGRLGLHKRQLAAHSLRPLLHGGQAQASHLLHNNVNQKMREQKSETRKKSTIFHIINPWKKLIGLLQVLHWEWVVQRWSFFSSVAAHVHSDYPTWSPAVSLSSWGFTFSWMRGKYPRAQASPAAHRELTRSQPASTRSCWPRYKALKNLDNKLTTCFSKLDACPIPKRQQHFLTSTELRQKTNRTRMRAVPPSTSPHLFKICSIRIIRNQPAMQTEVQTSLVILNKSATNYGIFKNVLFFNFERKIESISFTHLCRPEKVRNVIFWKKLTINQSIQNS